MSFFNYMRQNPNNFDGRSAISASSVLIIASCLQRLFENLIEISIRKTYDRIACIFEFLYVLLEMAIFTSTVKSWFYYEQGHLQ